MIPGRDQSASSTRGQAAAVVTGRDQLKDLIARWCPGDGVHASPVPGISCIKVSRPQQRAKRHWRASFCIAVQGTKEILLEGHVYREREPHYIVSPIDLPVTSRVVGVSPAQPLLCLRMDFDAVALREVAAQLDRARPDDLDHPGRAIFIGKASERMLDAAIRLGALLATPDDATVLAPLVRKELIFHLLKGPDGPAIRQLVRAGSQAHRIAEAVYRLHASLDEDVDIAALARAAGMSRAAFFKRFKEATAMSPLQYQKRLRLLEARRLMVEEGVSAESSAFRVGYTSPSQFSREYSRMFGNPPLRDARALKQTAAVVEDM
ncbi:AraC family transcriptional regulator N-terminal domain-containing protein [Sorangium sp. So ce1099]|uniref:AraC family transcriptional regulator N-terminal domain-containing protein n=1 Tax=Sorangium sp. So ce1099 TaxID=3133331 RepID=UPI003F609BBA